jgi:hypothetical protein
MNGLKKNKKESLMSVQGVPLTTDPVVLVGQLQTMLTQDESGFRSVQILTQSIPTRIESIKSASKNPEKTIVDQAIDLHLATCSKLKTMNEVRLQCETTTRQLNNALLTLENEIVQQLAGVERARDQILKAYREKIHGVDGYLGSLLYARTSELERYHALIKELPANQTSEADGGQPQAPEDGGVIVMDENQSGTPEPQPQGTLLNGQIDIPAEDSQAQTRLQDDSAPVADANQQAEQPGATQAASAKLQEQLPVVERETPPKSLAQSFVLEPPGASQAAKLQEPPPVEENETPLASLAQSIVLETTLSQQTQQPVAGPIGEPEAEEKAACRAKPEEDANEYRSNSQERPVQTNVAPPVKSPSSPAIAQPTVRKRLTPPDRVSRPASGEPKKQPHPPKTLYSN